MTPTKSVEQQRQRAEEKTKRITLCGSTKFKKEFEAINRQLSLEGHTVYTVAFFGHADKIPLTAEQKTILDGVHKRKIDNSDGIFVIDVDGYIGESTQSEIEHARFGGKFIRYLSEYPDLKYISDATAMQKDAGEGDDIEKLMSEALNQNVAALEKGFNMSNSEYYARLGWDATCQERDRLKKELAELKSHHPAENSKGEWTDPEVIKIINWFEYWRTHPDVGTTGEKALETYKKIKTKTTPTPAEFPPTAEGEAEFNEKYKGRSPFAAHIKNEKELPAEGDREGVRLTKEQCYNQAFHEVVKEDTSLSVTNASKRAWSKAMDIYANQFQPSPRNDMEKEAWIDVKDRLPEADESGMSSDWLFLHTKSGYSIGYYILSSGLWYSRPNTTKVTHWMKPSPPQFKKPK